MSTRQRVFGYALGLTLVAALASAALFLPIERSTMVLNYLRAVAWPAAAVLALWVLLRIAPDALRDMGQRLRVAELPLGIRLELDAARQALAEAEAAPAYPQSPPVGPPPLLRQRPSHRPPVTEPVSPAPWEQREPSPAPWAAPHPSSEPVAVPPVPPPPPSDTDDESQQALPPPVPASPPPAWEPAPQHQPPPLTPGAARPQTYSATFNNWDADEYERLRTYLANMVPLLPGEKLSASAAAERLGQRTGVPNWTALARSLSALERVEQVPEVQAEREVLLDRAYSAATRIAAYPSAVPRNEPPGASGTYHWPEDS